MSIGNVKLVNDSRVGIWDSSMNKKAEFDLGRDEDIVGFNSEYVVVFGGTYARVINSSGNQKASIYVDHGQSVRSVTPKGIIIDSRGSSKLVDFKGNFITNI